MEHKKSNTLVVQYFPGSYLDMFFLKFQAMNIYLWVYYFKILSRLSGSLKKKRRGAHQE